jgi:hypothetical protein
MRFESGGSHLRTAHFELAALTTKNANVKIARISANGRGGRAVMR